MEVALAAIAGYALLAWNLSIWLYLTGKLVYITGEDPADATPMSAGLTRGLVFGAPLSLPVYLGYVGLTALCLVVLRPRS